MVEFTMIDNKDGYQADATQLSLSDPLPRVGDTLYVPRTQERMLVEGIERCDNPAMVEVRRGGWRGAAALVHQDTLLIEPASPHASTHANGTESA